MAKEFLITNAPFDGSRMIFRRRGLNRVAVNPAGDRQAGRLDLPDG
jgi:hypothetical protein